MASQRGAWPISGAIASLAGIAATVVQIVERISLAENPHASLSCNISKLISCTDVLLAPQASVFRRSRTRQSGCSCSRCFLPASQLQ